jgi:hypothetical protein
MDETPTNSEKVLMTAMRLCAGDSGRHFTAEELAVAAWLDDKSTFGLRGYEDTYPDSNKLFKSIDSKGGLVAKGLIAKVGDRTFRLTAGGIAAGSQLSPSNSEQQHKLEREVATAINKLVSHPVFAEWIRDHSKPTKFSSAGQFWGVAPGTPARVVRDRIANIEATLKQALQYMVKRGVNSLFREKDRVLCERQDIERCLEFHEVLKQRFARELNILLA